MSDPSEPEAGTLRPRRARPPAGRRLRRRAIAAGAALVAVWLVLVFAGILSRAEELEATAGREQREVEALRVRADLMDREIRFVGLDMFLEQAARGLGLGPADERRFRLPEGAPSPPPVVPLGAP